jgi:uncharacterized protein (DUF1800 family)
MVLQNCAINSIAVYEPSPQKPWNLQRITHLYRRLGFGASYEDIQSGLAMTPSQLVDQLIDNTAALSPPTPTTWANFTATDYNGDDDLIFQHQQEFFSRWIREMATEGIRSKIALFWHNHFVTELDVYNCNSSLWAYYNLLHIYALGNFRTFVEEIGKTPAMLVYLNGDQNIADQPNENYARELMELFTMGEGNGYTQEDIVEVSRALTGWRMDSDECTPSYFDGNYFDSDPKTIFDQTGNWNYNDVHELIFTARQNQVAHYICGKIYSHFISPIINEEMVNEMATTFMGNNWELAPVFRQIFKSEHFFDEFIIGTQIKDPFSVFINLLKMSNFQYQVDYADDTTGTIGYMCRELGQNIFNPIDVAGWPGYRTWLNENTLTSRWSFSSQLLFDLNETAKNKLVALAIDLTNNSNDPVVIVEAVAQHYIGLPLDMEHLEVAVLNFKGEIPENYFQDGSWNLFWDEAPDQMVNLLSYLTRLPEYQLS